MRDLQVFFVICILVYFCFEWPLVVIILEIYVPKISGLSTINISSSYYYYYSILQNYAQICTTMFITDEWGTSRIFLALAKVFVGKSYYTKVMLWRKSTVGYHVILQNQGSLVHNHLWLQMGVNTPVHSIQGDFNSLSVFLFLEWMPSYISFQ